MLTSTTINLWLQEAAISQYLASADNARSNVLNWGQDKAEKDLPFTLYSVRTAVEYAKTYYLNTPGLDLSATYMYALCGKYLSRAQNIVNNVTGVIVYNPTNGVPMNISTPIIQIVVGPSASLHEGDTTYTVVDTHIVPNSLEIWVDGVRLPYNVNTQLSYSVLYQQDSAVVTFLNQALVNDQIVVIRYDKVIPL